MSLGGIGFVLLGIVCALYTKDLAKASSSFFPPPVYIDGLSSATTSPVYMTPGKATSTLTYDSYYVNSLGNTTKTDSGVVLLQVSASSTATTIATDVEYSQDNIDWFQDGGVAVPAFSTTTRPVGLALVSDSIFTFASTTAGRAAVGANQATTTRAFAINTPTRYIRLVFTMPVGSANGTVWAQFVPAKENNN